jgi:hypothetical protein
LFHKRIYSIFLRTLVGKRKQTIFEKRWFDITTSVNDTGGKFAAGVKDAGGNLPPVSTTPAANSPLVSLTPLPNNGNNNRLQTPESELERKNLDICFLYYPKVTKQNY